MPKDRIAYNVEPRRSEGEVIEEQENSTPRKSWENRRKRITDIVGRILAKYHKVTVLHQGQFTTTIRLPKSLASEKIEREFSCVLIQVRFVKNRTVSTVVRKTSPAVHFVEQGSTTKSKRKYCKQCRKKTRHVVSFFSYIPYICANAHPNDQTHCAVCQKKLPKSDGTLERLMSQVGLPPIRKRFCPECTAKTR